MEIVQYLVVSLYEGLVDAVTPFDTEEEAERFLKASTDGERGCFAGSCVRKVTVEVEDGDVFQYAMDTFDTLIDTDNPPERD